MNHEGRSRFSSLHNPCADYYGPPREWKTTPLVFESQKRGVLQNPGGSNAATDEVITTSVNQVVEFINTSLVRFGRNCFWKSPAGVDCYVGEDRLKRDSND